MGKTIFTILGILLALVGTILLYDARLIVKNTFSTDTKNENESTTALKIVGYTFLSVGGIIISIIL